jgi:hypothetical protein
MRPYRHSFATSRLLSLRFEATPRDGEGATLFMSRPPITVEDNAFVSWWRPDVYERIRILHGAPVRVLVNYSLHGPLYLDTELGWGTSRGGSR